MLITVECVAFSCPRFLKKKMRICCNRSSPCDRPSVAQTLPFIFGTLIVSCMGPSLAPMTSRNPNKGIESKIAAIQPRA